MKKRQYYPNFAIKRSLSTIKRTWVPLPIVPASSAASTANVSLRPSTSVSVAVARTFAPMADGFMCVVCIYAPTVVEPCGKAGATAFIAAFSINATIAGVAKTSRSPDPIVTAQFDSATTVSLVKVIPFFGIVYLIYS